LCGTQEAFHRSAAILKAKSASQLDAEYGIVWLRSILCGYGPGKFADAELHFSDGELDAD
jgi:hypothetical protein